MVLRPPLLHCSLPIRRVQFVNDSVLAIRRVGGVGLSLIGCVVSSSTSGQLCGE